MRMRLGSCLASTMGLPLAVGGGVTRPLAIQQSHSRNRLGALPILEWLSTYPLQFARRDFSAGISLAAFAIPGSLAYASLAGLPPQAGLYCYLLAGVGYAIFGTSRQAAVGPTSAISILIGATLGGLAAGDAARHASLAAVTAMLVACLALVAWLVRAGQIVHFISATVLTGFKAGVAIQIASTQLPKLIGIPASGDDLFGRLAYLFSHLGDAHMPSLLVGTCGLALLVLGDRFFPKRPTVLVALILSIVLMSTTSLGTLGIAVMGAVPQGLPALGLPPAAWADVSTLLPLAFACFLLSYIESVSVARSFALKHGYAVDPNQELIGLASANLAVSLGQGYPVACGMSQSAVNDAAGARTPLAILVTSLVICVVLLFFTGLFRTLPAPMLAAVVLMAVAGLFDVRDLSYLRKVSSADFRVALVALAGVLAFGVLNGVVLAAVVSLLILIRRAARPHTAVLVRIPGTDQYGDQDRHPHGQSVPGVLIYRAYGGIVYFNVDHVEADLRQYLDGQREPVTRVIFDLSSSPLVDLAGARMLASLHAELAARGSSLEIAEARGQVRDLLKVAGVAERLGVDESPRSVAAICGGSR